MVKKNAALAKGFSLPVVNQNIAVDENAAVDFEKEVVKKTRRSKKATLRRESRGERLAVYVPEDIACELRVLCAKERRSLSDAVTVALNAWLNKHRDK
jgi:hypothetical protein